MPFCDACGSGHGRLDNYCRHCGAHLHPDPDERGRPAALATVSSAALRPWIPDRPALVRSIAALGAGAAVELLRRRLAMKPIGFQDVLHLLGTRRNGRDRQPIDALIGRGDGAEDVLETIVIRWHRKR